MKKTLMTIFCAFLIVVTHSTLHGEQNEPANKNLLDPDLFEIEYGSDPSIHASIHSTDPIKLPEMGEYTLSFPTQMGSDIEIKAYGNNEQDPYIDETLSELGDGCGDDGSYFWTCTFEADEDPFHLEMSGGSEMAQYLNNSHFEYLQLEQGSVRTEYTEFKAKEDAAPEITGTESIHIYHGVNQSLNTTLEKNIEVHDEIDGIIPTDDIQIKHDDYSGNETTVGDYTVTLEAEDTAGNTASFDLKIHIYDNVNPEISGRDHVVVDVDDERSIDDIITEHITFSDDYDGEINDYELVQDDYSEAIGTLGEKTVTMEIEDSSGNVASRDLTIETLDYDAPTIRGEKTLKVYQSDMPTLETLEAQFSIEDNHTPEAAVSVAMDSGTYTTDAASGSYPATITATDASDNEATMDVTIEVIDDIAPTLYGRPVESISYTESFDKDAFIETMAVVDNDDESLSNASIVGSSDDYEDGVPGRYTYDFEIEDASGNKASHTLTLEVIDDVAPTFKTIATTVVTKDAPLNEDAIQNILMDDASLQAFNPVSYEIVHDEYKDHREEEGTYLYTAEFSNEDGETTTRSVELEVVDIEKDPPVPIGRFIGAVSLFTLAGVAVWIAKRH
ncbi:MAG: hypothetical protein ACOC2X_00305 [Bacillota bacterium]